MTVLNSEIAEKFNELADLLEIEEANPFRIRAYRNAARLIENLPHEAADLIAEGKDLSELHGIGKDLAEKITTIVKTGHLPLLEEMQKKAPRALSEMMKIPDLGPQKVKKLYKELNIKNINDLKKAVTAEKISKLEGFGNKTQEKIKQALKKFTGKERRIRLSEAERVVKPLLAYLQKLDGVTEAVVAGSYRRRKETIGDIDILVTAKKDTPVIKHFIDYEDVTKIVSQGETRSTINLRSGLQVDLRVVEQGSFGAALQYFTGSKEHNITVRSIAVKKNLKLNEYGLFKGKKQIAGQTEPEIYNKLGLAYIEPELRENHGEVEKAQAGPLPKLVTLADIKGDLHCHSNDTDGQDSIADLANAAKQQGYNYIAITDHSKHVTIAHGLDDKGLMKQIKKIDQLNEKLKDFRVLKSTEVDILEDGSLDISNEVLKQLDFTVCAIHYKFNLSKQQQTERVLRAMDNPYFNIFAHPTGRLINKRDPYEIDLEKIMHKAKKVGCFLELNAQPERLDLNDVHCQMAKEIGVKLAISTDAHSALGFEYMQYGIDQARRGWLEPKDIINTLPWPALQKLLNRRGE